jgi:hypothetical protein
VAIAHYIPATIQRTTYLQQFSGLLELRLEIHAPRAPRGVKLNQPDRVAVQPLLPELVREGGDQRLSLVEVRTLLLPGLPLVAVERSSLLWRR